MTVRYFVAMIHVASVPRSIAFYAKLGFTVRNTHGPAGDHEPTWAWIHSDHAQLMLTQADEPVDPDTQAVLFYAYCDDVETFRIKLVAAGIDAGPISCPFYNPKGEFCITDPDGYIVMVAHT